MYLFIYIRRPMQIPHPLFCDLNLKDTQRADDQLILFLAGSRCHGWALSVRGLSPLWPKERSPVFHQRGQNRESTRQDQLFLPRTTQSVHDCYDSVFPVGLLAPENPQIWLLLYHTKPCFLCMKTLMQFVWTAP